MGPKTKSAHLLRWHYGAVFQHFNYLCEYAIRFDLSCSYCEYPFIFHCLHCSHSCFDPDSLLLAHLWLGLSWIYCTSANKSFSSPKTSSRKPYTSSKQQERQKHSIETTINFSSDSVESVKEVRGPSSTSSLRRPARPHTQLQQPLPQPPADQHRPHSQSSAASPASTNTTRTSSLSGTSDHQGPQEQLRPPLPW